MSYGTKWHESADRQQLTGRADGVAVVDVDLVSLVSQLHVGSVADVEPTDLVHERRVFGQIRHVEDGTFNALQDLFRLKRIRSTVVRVSQASYHDNEFSARL